MGFLLNLYVYVNVWSYGSDQGRVLLGFMFFLFKFFSYLFSLKRGNNTAVLC